MRGMPAGQLMVKTALNGPFLDFSLIEPQKFLKSRILFLVPVIWCEWSGKGP